MLKSARNEEEVPKEGAATVGCQNLSRTRRGNRGSETLYNIPGAKWDVESGSIGGGGWHVVTEPTQYKVGIPKEGQPMHGASEPE